MRILPGFLYKLYAFRRRSLRKIILRVVTRLEGGQMLSPTLRRIFADYHDIEIGLYSYGGCFNTEHIRKLTKIGRYCSFADGVCVFNANHPLEFKSMHPFFYEPIFGYIQTEQISRRGVQIGNDVWIGQGAIILASVERIGDGAVIGAGAVVTKDVPDFAVVVGNPAKVIKYRFSQESQCRVKASKWWEKAIEELQKDIEEFSRPLEG